VNASDRILLMIDEAHRTQGSDMGDNLFEAFPNAARVAFTGIRANYRGNMPKSQAGDFWSRASTGSMEEEV
jgi:type I site-specific restriction-modification system R (restriction) subunit